MLKNAYFLKKHENRRSAPLASGGWGRLPRCTSHLLLQLCRGGGGSSAMRFISIEIVHNNYSIGKCFTLPHFCTYFLLQTLCFYWQGR